MDYNEKIDIDKTLLNNELLLKLCPQYRNLLNLIFFIRNFEVFNVYLFSLKKKKKNVAKRSAVGVNLKSVSTRHIPRMTLSFYLNFKLQFT